MLDTVGNLFDSTTRKSALKGERIPVMSLDESLKPDPTLDGTDVVLPPPYKNEAWAEPGGYASNALHHLEASVRCTRSGRRTRARDRIRIRA